MLVLVAKTGMPGGRAGLGMRRMVPIWIRSFGHPSRGAGNVGQDPQKSDPLQTYRFGSCQYTDAQICGERLGD